MQADSFGLRCDESRETMDSRLSGVVGPIRGRIEIRDLVACLGIADSGVEMGSRPPRCCSNGVFVSLSWEGILLIVSINGRFVKTVTAAVAVT